MRKKRKKERQETMRHTGKHEPLLQPKLETPRGESKRAKAEDVGEEGHGCWMVYVATGIAVVLDGVKPSCRTKTVRRRGCA